MWCRARCVAVARVGARAAARLGARRPDSAHGSPAAPLAPRRLDPFARPAPSLINRNEKAEKSDELLPDDQ
jgi:hypothetical protein